MFKMIVLLKKKPGMSDAAFRDYYEGHHARLVMRSAPSMRKYVRNYLTPLGNAIYAADEGGAVDCVTEAWFRTKEEFEQTIAGILGSDIADALVRDEENLFDRPFIRWFAVEAIESDLSAHGL
jgi:DNA-binding GntR family transcriptional regulator